MGGGYRSHLSNTTDIARCQECGAIFFLGHDQAIPGHQLESRTWDIGRVIPSREFGGLASVGALSRSSLVDAMPPSEDTYRTRYWAALQQNG